MYFIFGICSGEIRNNSPKMFHIPSFVLQRYGVFLLRLPRRRRNVNALLGSSFLRSRVLSLGIRCSMLEAFLTLRSHDRQASEAKIYLSLGRRREFLAPDLVVQVLHYWMNFNSESCGRKYLFPNFQL